MQWNIRIFEQPGILFADRTVEQEEAPVAPTEELMKPGFEQERKLLAVITKLESDDKPILVPAGPDCDDSFEELAERVTQLLSEGESFAAASLCDGALRGAHGHDPELRLLSASVFEHIGFYDVAVPMLKDLASAFEDIRDAAIQIRLARALRKSGQVEDVSEQVAGPLEHPELPPILRVEGLLLKAMSKGGEEAVDILDELLDYAEEHLGDHRLVADALELHADILSESEPKKAEQFYHAAGKMLVQLQDPYFFSLNERFVVHFLKHRAYREAIDLSHEMFELLKQAGGPPVAAVPYFVFASHAHKVMGDKDRSEAAQKMAHEINDIEAKRLEGLLQASLN